MMKRNKGSGGASWMDTYGDMVTLLLCFFVLLCSMSTLDQQKWQKLVQSFNPDAIEEVTEMMGNGGDQTGMTQADVDQNINELYEQLQNYAAQQQAAENISVTKGDGYVFVSFRDAIFFEGDSYTLLPEGQAVLDNVAQILQQASDSIDEIRILGHTAQSTPGRMNNVQVDRFLASNRATVVLVYLQEKNILDPARMVSVGYGQWRPVADNGTAEGRAENRRVEMIITGLDLGSEAGDDITQYYTTRGSEQPGEQQTAGQTGTDAQSQNP